MPPPSGSGAPASQRRSYARLPPPPPPPRPAPAPAAVAARPAPAPATTLLKHRLPGLKPCIPPIAPDAPIERRLVSSVHQAARSRAAADPPHASSVQSDTVMRPVNDGTGQPQAASSVMRGIASSSSSGRTETPRRAAQGQLSATEQPMMEQGGFATGLDKSRVASGEAASSFQAELFAAPSAPADRRADSPDSRTTTSSPPLPSGFPLASRDVSTYVRGLGGVAAPIGGLVAVAPGGEPPDGEITVVFIWWESDFNVDDVDATLEFLEPWMRGILQRDTDIGNRPYRLHIAFVSASATLLVSRLPKHKRLAPQHGIQRIWHDVLPSADLVCGIGARALSYNLQGLAEELLPRMRPDTPLLLTQGGGASPSLVVEARVLQSAARDRLVLLGAKPDPRTGELNPSPTFAELLARYTTNKVPDDVVEVAQDHASPAQIATLVVDNACAGFFGRLMMSMGIKISNSFGMSARFPQLLAFCAGEGDQDVGAESSKASKEGKEGATGEDQAAQTGKVKGTRGRKPGGSASSASSIPQAGSDVMRAVITVPEVGAAGTCRYPGCTRAWTHKLNRYCDTHYYECKSNAASLATALGARPASSSTATADRPAVEGEEDELSPREDDEEDDESSSGEDNELGVETVEVEIRQPVRRPNGRWTCGWGDCAKTFDRPSAASRHRRTVHENPTSLCPHDGCGVHRRSRQKGAHERWHAAADPYALPHSLRCDLCRLIFSHDSPRHTHHRKHHRGAR